MQRRAVLLGSAALALTRCSGAAVTTLAQAKAYFDAGAGAVLAGAQQYLAGPPKPSAADAATVKTVMAALVAAQKALDGTVIETDWRATAVGALANIQSLLPFATPFLGPAGPYLPLAIAVVQAFIDALPAPPDTPAVPPAALSRKAAEFHR